MMGSMAGRRLGKTLCIAAVSFLLGACGGTGNNEQKTYIYVANSGIDTVETFAASDNGTVASVDNVATGGNPMVVAGDTELVFVANAIASSISRFSVDTDGKLSSLGADTLTGRDPEGMILHPTGKFLYVAAAFQSSDGNRVYQYKVNRAPASLTYIDNVQADGLDPNIPVGMAFDPAGKYLYVTNHAGGTISGYAIDNGTGALSPLSAGGSPFPVAASFPQPEGIVSVKKTGGSFLYVADESFDALIHRYRISPDNGALTYVDNVTMAIGPPDMLAVNPAGTLLFALSEPSGSVSVYSIADSGSLALAQQVRGNNLLNPESAMTDPDGKFLYVADSKVEATQRIPGEVFVYAIDGSQLSFVKSFPTGDGPFSLVVIRK